MSKSLHMLRGYSVGGTGICLAMLTANLLVGCGDETSTSGAQGNLSVLLEAEETISNGIEAGPGPEDIRDGWSAAFAKYVVVIGNVNLQLATDGSVQRQANELYAVDLTEVPESALPLWQINDLAAARWMFNYELGGAGATDGAERHASVSEADFAEMSTNDWTYLIDGEVTKVDGQACPPAFSATPPLGSTSVGIDADGNPCYPHPRVGFRFGASAEVAFTQCESDGLQGVAIPDGSTATVAATLHGDHMFFNGFPEEDEGGVLRLAQWMADSDLNLDGELTRAELESLATADLAVIDDRYQLGGPENTISTMWDLLIEQLKTQGHLNGEGECLADGAAHEDE